MAVISLDSFKQTPTLVFYLGLLVLWRLTIVIYRRYFHPLAKVPGPFLPAVTSIYEYYHNHIRKGQYYKQIEKLHQKYGPVVRVGPNEVHLSDPENYDKIYYVGTKYRKSEYYDCFAVPHAGFATTSNEVHRVRRAALNPYFSRKMALSLEDKTQSKAQKLCQRVAEGLKAGKSLNMNHGFRAVSIDVITDYAFDNCMNLLDAPEFGAGFFNMMQASAPSYNNFVQFPIMVYIIRNWPMWVSSLLGKNASEFKKALSGARKQVMHVKAAYEASGGKKPPRPTIFHHLLDPEVSSEHGVPSDDLLADEAQTLLAAASETTGNAMSMTTYYVISNEKIYQRLAAELKEAFPNADEELEYRKVEKLPYLTAVIKEGLRLSFGVIHRLPRVVPEPGATFNGVYIPAGAVVGMDTWHMHQHEPTFPEPTKYDPDRWLDPKVAQQLDKYVVPFSRGSRSCLGMNLAYEELYVTLGTFFRRFDNLVVDGTGPKDLLYEDYFNMYHPAGARKLHVKVKGT